MPRKEKEHKYHFIYKTTNIKNGKFYIGMHSTNNLNDGYLGGGKRLRNSVRKHGKDVHVREILEYLPDRSSLDLREREIVNSEMLKNPLCMNLIQGGDGGFPLNPDHIKVFSSSGNKAFLERYNNDEDLKKKFKDLGTSIMKDLHKNGKIKYGNWKGKTHTDETKKRMSEKRSGKQTGEKNSQYGKIWVTNEKIDKKIRIEELDIFLSDGWRRGRNSKCNLK